MTVTKMIHRKKIITSKRRAGFVDKFPAVDELIVFGYAAIIFHVRDVAKNNSLHLNPPKKFSPQQNKNRTHRKIRTVSKKILAVLFFRQN